MELEQYPTGPHIASRMLFMVRFSFSFAVMVILEVICFLQCNTDGEG